MKSDWKIVSGADFIDFNPRLSLKKGTVATKIAMDKLRPFTKKIPESEQAAFSGGAKFANGDTIMARITPCLENGKTAFVDCLAEGEIAFGSTEFIVLRAKEGVSDARFLYYLAISPDFRDLAIKSMVGTSGRQRVQQSVLETCELRVPPLETQRKIAAILSALDDKIELNRRINANLEQQAAAIFKSKFCDFDDNAGQMPSKWNVATFGEIAEVVSGKRPPMKQPEFSEDVNVPLVGASTIMGYTNNILYNEPILVIGRVGTHGVVQRFQTPCWPSDNTLVIKSEYYEYAFHFLKNVDYVNMNRGSTQPLITQTDLKNLLIVLPEKRVLKEFEKLTGTLMARWETNRAENEQLAAVRDALLPRLMSGEINVSDVSL